LEGFLTNVGLSGISCASPRVKRTSPPKVIPIEKALCLLSFDEAKKVQRCNRKPVPKGDEQHVMCERPSIPVCEDGWSELENVCYRTFTSPKKPVTQSEAEAACVKEQGHLVSVHNEAQQKFLTQLIGDASKTYTDEKKNRGRFYFWIGLKMDWKDDSKLVKFEWSDGSKVDYNHPLDNKGKKPWDGKNPDNEYEREQTCTLMYGNEITIGGSTEYAGEWQDAPCNNDKEILPIIAVRSYLCQKPGRKGTCIGASPNPTDGSLKPIVPSKEALGGK